MVRESSGDRAAAHAAVRVQLEPMPERSPSGPPTPLAIPNSFCCAYSVMIFTRVLETNSTPGGSLLSTRKCSAA